MTTPQYNLRADFEEWLQREHMLDSEWDEGRNCFKDFPAHLAYKAYCAGRAAQGRQQDALDAARYRWAVENHILSNNTDLPGNAWSGAENISQAIDAARLKGGS